MDNAQAKLPVFATPNNFKNKVNIIVNVNKAPNDDYISCLSYHNNAIQLHNSSNPPIPKFLITPQDQQKNIFAENEVFAKRDRIAMSPQDTHISPNKPNKFDEEEE